MFDFRWFDSYIKKIDLTKIYLLSLQKINNIAKNKKNLIR